MTRVPNDRLPIRLSLSRQGKYVGHIMGLFMGLNVLASVSINRTRIADEDCCRVIVIVEGRQFLVVWQHLRLSSLIRISTV